MGEKAHRMGDLNTGAGAITSIPQSKVFCNSKLLAVNGSKGTSHPVGVPHSAGVWETANGSSTVKVGGIPVNREFDADTCTHLRTGGSSNVKIG